VRILSVSPKCRRRSTKASIVYAGIVEVYLTPQSGILSAG
jgi:hypothetical protein